jgi:hypothetical protein
MNRIESFKQWFLCKGNPDRIMENTAGRYGKKVREFRIGLGIIGFLELLFIISIYALPVLPTYSEKLGVIVAGMAAIATLIVGITTNYYQNKDQQAKALFKVFELLSTPEVRKARSTIHQKYREHHHGGSLLVIEWTGLKDETDLVLSSFDQVSGIVLNRLLDIELFADLYEEMIVREWNTLEGDILMRQHKNKKTLLHFTTLKNKVASRPNLGNVIPY